MRCGAHDVGNFSVRLFLDIRRRFVAPFLEFDGMELEGNLLLVKYYRDTLGAGRQRVSVELENHCERKNVVGL